MTPILKSVAAPVALVAFGLALVAFAPVECAADEPPSEEASADDSTGGSFEESREQGILYFKKERYKQSKASLDRAYKSKGGDKDFGTVFHRGRAAFKLLILEQAFQMADKALILAGEDARKLRVLEEWTTEMKTLFGGVTIKAAQGETNSEGRVFLEAKTGIINKEKKQAFLSIRERFRTTDVQVPTTIYLPFGEYTGNNVPFAIVEGEPAPTVELFLQVVRGKEGDDSGLLLYAGIGGAVAVAAGVAAFFLLSDDQKPRTEQQARLVFQSLTERKQ